MPNSDCRTIRKLFNRMEYLSEIQIQKVTDHLADCEECSTHLARLTLETVSIGSQPDPDLADAILTATSGNPCVDAQECIAESFDNTLTHRNQALLNSHINHCSHCDDMAQTLPKICNAVNTTALWVPDPGFAMDIMRETVNSPSGRCLAWCRQCKIFFSETLYQRPRIAMEAAYVAAVLMLGIFQLPGIKSIHAGSFPMTESVVNHLETQVDHMKNRIMPYLENDCSRVRALAESRWQALKTKSMETIINFHLDILNSGENIKEKEDKYGTSS